jgi:hypothetical protein
MGFLFTTEKRLIFASFLSPLPKDFKLIPHFEKFILSQKLTNKS